MIWSRLVLVFCITASIPAAEAAPWVGSGRATRATFASSPDNTFRVLREFLRSARESIHLSVYQLDNPAIGEALEEALGRRVEVSLLLEGAPIPKIPKNELYIARRLSSLGARVLFYAQGEKGAPRRTFKYFHAKYGVVDGRRVIVGSANYGLNGHPVDNTAGNREWEVVLDDRDAASYFESAFEHDVSIPGEVVAYGSSERYRLDDPSYQPEDPSRAGSYSLALEPAEDHDVPYHTLFAPENSLGTDSPLFKVLTTAQRSIDVEQLNLETYWGDKPYNPQPEDSPLIDELLKRARAGVSIRVLLNNDEIFRDPNDPRVWDSWEAPLEVFFGKAKRDNRATLDYITRIAGRESLDLTVRIFNYRACHLNVLHNKGMIVDSQYATVSSLNWGESAMKFNREAGVVLKSAQAARYYGRAFDYDWQCSGNSELALRN
jgi:phosphatidylserine/phosphatidylglycerophosphate/cardiolipin synthase-like enzyme